MYIQRAQITSLTGGTQWDTLSKMPFWTLTIVLPHSNNFETKLFTSLPFVPQTQIKAVFDLFNIMQIKVSEENLPVYEMVSFKILTALSYIEG